MLANKGEIFRKFVETCSTTPGIYKILDENDTIIYIGKAKNLKSRLSDYTNDNNLPYKTKMMIFQCRRIEIITTNNEAEALILESNLVKKHQPKYNILLKDDKSFPYICIDDTSDFPRITKYRGLKKDKMTYFGPFVASRKVDEVISALQKTFLIRSCTDSFFKSRTRPCILYQIKRCSAPCVAKISKPEYETLVSQAKDFLKGKSNNLYQALSAQMDAASEAMDYEKAATYRDRIRALSFIQSKQIMDLDDIRDIDVVCGVAEQDIIVIQIYFIRSGQNLGGKTYEFKHSKDAHVKEMMSTFLGKFYQNNMIPEQIIVNPELEDAPFLEKAFSELAGRSVKIIHPKQGKKLELIKFAQDNIKDFVNKKLYLQEKHVKYFEMLKEFFKLPLLERVEIYDNSHISGTNALGVMVVSTRSGFEKNEYRKYNIKSTNIDPNDDYAMMREVISRRFANKNIEAPQLVIIDGGKGHLSSVLQVLEKERDFLVISIAKGIDRNSGNEVIFTERGEEVSLDKSDKLKQYLQVLRDEAHRFAITSHRKKRISNSLNSCLNSIEGLGSARRRILLQHFSSIDDIKKASIEDIAKIDGIGKKIAGKIREYFDN